MQTPDTASSPRRLLLTFQRRWRLFLLVWLAVVGAAALLTCFQTRKYKPQVSLEIRPEQSVIVTATDPNKSNLEAWETYFKTQQTILTSPSLINRCLKSLPEAIRAGFELRDDPIKDLTDKVDIEVVRQSFVIKVGVVDEDAAKATQIANTLVSLYLEETNQRMRDVKAESVESLSKDTLPGMKKAFQDSEIDLKKFQEASGFIDLEEQYKALCEAWKKVLLALEDVRLRRMKAAAQLDALSKYKSDGTGADLNPDLNKTRVLDRLSQDRDKILQNLASEQLRHKDGHPSVLALRAQLTEIEGKMAVAVEGALLSYQTDVNSATIEEGSLAEELRSLEQQMAKAGTQLTEFRRLGSEVVAAKDLYASYVKRHGEESATAGSGVSSVRVIDFATLPKKPWRPNIPINMVIGCLAAFMFAGGAVLAADQVDNRLLSAEEVEVFVGLEVLSVIPKLSAADADGPTVLGEFASIAEFEAFRGLRAEILTRFEKIPGAKTLAVMSPLSGDGKSTVALNLAKVMAMEGKRVLLIDADMRRPKLSRYISQAGGPGLDAVLDGRASLEEAAQPSKISGVHILGLEEGLSGAAELAGSQSFDSVMNEARQKWDFIIVDNAPTLQASESAMVARRLDAAIMVVREKKTGRAAARAAVKRLAGMGVKVLGAVLNCAVPHGSGYGYGYGYGYGESGKSKKDKASRPGIGQATEPGLILGAP